MPFMKLMDKYSKSLGFLLFFLCLGINHPLYSQNSLPNIVLIVADDLGYGDLGCYGATDICTPNIDKLAAHGALLKTFYANGPECTPTRAALLTGRYQQRIGGLECAIGLGNVGRYDQALALSNQHNLGLPPDQNALTKILKEKEYRTALIGKWHLGQDEKFRPENQGFDFSIGPLGGAVDYFHHTEPIGVVSGIKMNGNHDLNRDGEEHHREGYYMTHLITDESVEWINRQNNEHPFFMYIPYTSPHHPMQTADDYQEEPMTHDDWFKGGREDYANVVESMDEGIGRIVKKLEAEGLANNTLIIFFSDNGPHKKGSAGIYSGHKGSVLEGGIRVPCVIQWPDHIKPGTVSSQMAISMDFTASIAQFIDVTPDRPLDGMDIIGHIASGEKDFPRTLFWRLKRANKVLKAVRDGNLKYIVNNNGGDIKEYLFDLATDPQEKENQLIKRSEKSRDLKRKLDEWEREVEAVR